jgi:hypothetical protein
MTFPSVTFQITPESKPSTLSWMGEVTAFAQVLTHEGILAAIAEQVRFTRARFGRYETLDFVAVLLSYAVSGEPTLLAFYELAPSLNPLPFSCRPHSADIGSPANALSKGSACSQTVSLSRRFV